MKCYFVPVIKNNLDNLPFEEDAVTDLRKAFGGYDTRAELQALIDAEPAGSEWKTSRILRISVEDVTDETTQ